MTRSRITTLLFATLLTVACAGFVALGNWQLQRRVWKLDLIARVDARLKAMPTKAPGPDQWQKLTVGNDEYRHICIDGTLLTDKETLVQAVTRLGPGSWVLTPLRTGESNLVLINRGFVDADHRDAATRTTPNQSNSVHLCGLLRFSEPVGAFLHHNDPVAGRWYSRDVTAIAAARDLDTALVAPYFIDADASPDASAWPVGGLTVVHFRNSHLSYALTWYGLALLSGGGLVHLIQLQRRRVQSSNTT
jgi:surfeit locus 1 family protein